MASLKQACIAANLANVETPGYHRFDVVLEKAKESLPLEKTHPAHLSGRTGSGLKLVRDSVTSWRNDGNNVDPDAELVRMVENSLYYQTVIKAVSGQLAIARLIATEGRR